MRFMVMAAERAATMAMTIHKIWRNVGQPEGVLCATRAASSAPVSAKGSAKIECSNLIISSTMRNLPAMAQLRLRFLRRGLAGPAEHLLLRKINLREHAADVLRHDVVDALRMIVKSGNRRHDHGAGLLSAQHVFQMDAVERRVAHAEDELAAFLEHDVGGACDEIIAGPIGDCAQCPHGAWNHEHGIDGVTPRSDRCTDVFVRKHFNLRRGAPEEPARKLPQITRRDAQLFSKETLPGFGDDQVDARNASVFFKQYECPLCEDCPAGSGHTNRNALFFGVRHVFRAGKFSLAAACGQVKHARGKLPMVEFAAVIPYGSAGTSENSGSRAVRSAFSRQSDRAA